MISCRQGDGMDDATESKAVHSVVFNTMYSGLVFDAVKALGTIFRTNA